MPGQWLVRIDHVRALPDPEPTGVADLVVAGCVALLVGAMALTVCASVCSLCVRAAIGRRRRRADAQPLQQLSIVGVAAEMAELGMEDGAQEDDDDDEGEGEGDALRGAFPVRAAHGPTQRLGAVQTLSALLAVSSQLVHVAAVFVSNEHLRSLWSEPPHLCWLWAVVLEYGLGFTPFVVLLVLRMLAYGYVFSKTLHRRLPTRGELLVARAAVAGGAAALTVGVLALVGTRGIDTGRGSECAMNTLGKAVLVAWAACCVAGVFAARFVVRDSLERPLAREGVVLRQVLLAGAAGVALCATLALLNALVFQWGRVLFTGAVLAVHALAFVRLTLPCVPLYRACAPRRLVYADPCGTGAAALRDVWLHDDDRLVQQLSTVHPHPTPAVIGADGVTRLPIATLSSEAAVAQLVCDRYVRERFFDFCQAAGEFADVDVTDDGTAGRPGELAFADDDTYVRERCQMRQVARVRTAALVECWRVCVAWARRVQQMREDNTDGLENAQLCADYRAEILRRYVRPPPPSSREPIIVNPGKREAAAAAPPPEHHYLFVPESVQAMLPPADDGDWTVRSDDVAPLLRFVNQTLIAHFHSAFITALLEETRAYSRVVAARLNEEI